MKTTNLFKAVAFVAMTIVSVMNTEVKAQENNFITNEAVSYTHLDVYKRQDVGKVNTLDFHTLHQLAAEVQAGGRRRKSSFVACKNRLETFGICLLYTSRCV